MVSKMSVETCFTVGFPLENSLKTMVEHIIDTKIFSNPLKSDDFRELL